MVPQKEREIELAFDNRRLLSVFFVVVAMLGVFFTVGYVVGKSASPVLADSSQRTPIIVDSVAAPAVKGGPIESPTSGMAPVSKVAAVEQKAPEKYAAQAPPEPKQSTLRTVANVEPVKAASVPTELPAKEPARKDEPQSTPHVESAAASAGSRSYLQLAATSKPDADTMVDVLRQKGFSTVAVEIRERPGTWRVLVGPVNDSGNALRADLQKMGFPGNDALRRTF